MVTYIAHSTPIGSTHGGAGGSGTSGLASPGGLPPPHHGLAPGGLTAHHNTGGLSHNGLQPTEPIPSPLQR